LDVKLIGRGMEYWPYFLEAFKKLGTKGIGPGRGRFRLARAWAIDPLGPWETLVYDGQTDALRNEILISAVADIERVAERLPSDQVTIHFVTPMQLKYKGEFVRQPAFHVLVRTILRRLSSLSYFHCGSRWEIDYRGIIEAAKEVDAVKANVGWEAWERVSGRQGRRLSMGGVVGDMTYVGPIDRFRAILVAGMVVQVGKGTVFGNGQFQIQGSESRM
jgi:hypothetical protein